MSREERLRAPDASRLLEMSASPRRSAATAARCWGPPGPPAAGDWGAPGGWECHGRGCFLWGGCPQSALGMSPWACPPGHPWDPCRSQLRVLGRKAVRAPTAGGEGQEKGAWAGCEAGGARRRCRVRGRGCEHGACASRVGVQGTDVNTSLLDQERVGIEVSVVLVQGGCRGPAACASGVCVQGSAVCGVGVLLVQVGCECGALIKACASQACVQGTGVTQRCAHKAVVRAGRAPGALLQACERGTSVSVQAVCAELHCECARGEHEGSL